MIDGKAKVAVPFVPDTPAMQAVGQVVDRALNRTENAASRDRSLADGARMLAAAIVMVAPKTTMNVAADTETPYAMHVIESLEAEIRRWCNPHGLAADLPDPDDWIIAAAILWSRAKEGVTCYALVERAAQLHRQILSRFAGRLAKAKSTGSTE